MPDRDVTYIDPTTGLPVIVSQEAEIWGGGLLGDRPVTGENTGDLFFLVEGGFVRLQRWNGAAWEDLRAVPTGAAGGALQGTFPNPGINLAQVPTIIGEGYSGPISTTTSTTFQNKVTVVLPEHGPGTFEIEATYGWNHDAGTNDFEARILLGGVQLAELHKQEPKDSAGGDPTGTTQRYYVSRKFRVTAPGVIAAGELLELDYRTDSGGVESSIWEASLIMRQIA